MATTKNTKMAEAKTTAKTTLENNLAEKTLVAKKVTKPIKVKKVAQGDIIGGNSPTTAKTKTINRNAKKKIEQETIVIEDALKHKEKK